MIQLLLLMTTLSWLQLAAAISGDPSTTVYSARGQKPCSNIAGEGFKKGATTRYTNSANSACVNHFRGTYNGGCTFDCTNTGIKATCLRIDYGFYDVREDCFEPKCDDGSTPNSWTGDYYKGVSFTCPQVDGTSGSRTCTYSARKDIGGERLAGRSYELTRTCESPTFAPTPVPTPMPTPNPTPAPTPLPCKACSNTANPSTKLSIIKTAGGIEASYQTFYKCTTSNLLEVDGNSGSNLQGSANGKCGELVHLSAVESVYSLTSKKPGDLVKYTMTQTVTMNLATPAVRKYTGELFVPFDSSVQVSVRQKGTISAIPGRQVTFVIDAVAAAPFGGAKPILSDRAITTTTPAHTGPLPYTFVTTTDSAGRARMFLRWPTDKKTMAQLPTKINVAVMPAESSGLVTFSYTGCPMDGEPGPCQFTGVAEHELFVDSQHVFEDESSITLTGKLPYGDSGCYATDLELHGFATGDKPDAPTYTGAFNEYGSFSMSVQAGTSVTLKFKRDSAPNYYFVRNGQEVEASVLIPSATTQGSALVDVSHLIDFRVMTARDGSAGYGLANVLIPLQASLCEFPLAGVTSDNVKLSFKHPACDGNDKKRAIAPPSDAPTFATTRLVDEYLIYENAPPLLFENLALSISEVVSDDAKAASQKFAVGYAPQTLDARLPQLPRTTGTGEQTKVTAVASQHLGSVLRDSLRLLMPFDGTTNDATTARQRVTHTITAPAQYRESNALGDQQLHVEINSTAFAFGQNPYLDIRKAATFSFWLIVEQAPGSDGAVLFQVDDALSTDDVTLMLMPPKAGASEPELHLFSSVDEGGARLVLSASLKLDKKQHVAVVLDDGKPAVLYIDGEEAASGADNTNSLPYGPRSLHTCSARRFQFECVRHSRLLSGSDDGVAGFVGALDDYAMWTRALLAQDVAFVHAAGVDGMSLGELLSDSAHPAFIYRTDASLRFPPADIRFFPPPRGGGEEVDGEMSSTRNRTIADVLTGEALFPNKCDSLESSPTGDRPTEFEVYRVQAGGALSVLAQVSESYENPNGGAGLQCFQVRGSVRMRATFADTCKPVVMNNGSLSDITNCNIPFGQGSYGYTYFNGIIGDATLIPINKTSIDGRSNLDLSALPFAEVARYFGEFSMTFNGPQNQVKKSLLFHVNGFKGPEAASSSSLPVSDIPLIRLYKPPGDQSSAFLERGWAKSVSLSLEREGGTTFRAYTENTLRASTGGEMDLCLSTGAVVGAPGAGALTSFTSCQSNKAEQFIEATVAATTDLGLNNGIALSEAFSEEFMTTFETQVNHNAIGKWGDIVVTVGMTLLIDDQFLVSLDVQQSGLSNLCTIRQVYSPEWKPIEDGIMDTLQITPRIAVPPQIADFRRLAEVVARDCQLDTSSLDLAPPEVPAAASRTTDDSTLLNTHFDNCVTPIVGGEPIPVTETDAKETLLAQFRQSVDGVIRWSRILHNWEAITCKAMAMAGKSDYYVSFDGKDTPCETLDADNNPIADLKLFNLLGGNNNAEFQQQRDEALASIDKAFSRSARLRELCGPAYDNVQSLGVSVRRLSIFNDVKCDVADDEMSTEFITIRPVDPNNGVAKLQFEGGTTFSYATTATVTRSETYTVGTSSEITADLSGSFGFEFEFGSAVGGALSVGVGGGITRSNSQTSTGAVESSETTTVGFTVSDESIHDEFAVSIFIDPVYGTPIFVTTGGWSMCPHEPGTNARQKFDVYPVGTEEDPIELVVDDPDERIELPIAAQLSSTRDVDNGYDWVYDLQVTYDSDLTVTYKDEIVGIGGNHPVQFSNDEMISFGPVRAKRGSRFSYKGVYLYIISECDDAVLTQYGVDNGVYFNLLWKPKCAVAHFNITSVDGGLFPSERPFFVINTVTPKMATIRIDNPELEDLPWALIQGEFELRVEYRAVSEQSAWQPLPGATFPRLRFCQNDEPAGSPGSCYEQCTEPGNEKCCAGAGNRCSDATPCCSNVGLQCVEGFCEFPSTSFVELTFDSTQLSTQEALYEMRVVTDCQGDKRTESEPIQGRIDRVRPRLFGAFQQPADRLWWPGDEISLRYTEEIVCTRPLPFQTTIVVDGVETPLENNIDLICERNKVEVAFARTLISKPDALIGKDVTIRLSSVVDLALNPADVPGEWTFKVGEFDEAQVGVRMSDVRVPASLVTGSAADNAAIVAALLGSSDDAAASQIDVTPSPDAAPRKRQAGDETDDDTATVSISLEIKPSASVDGGSSALRVAGQILANEMADTSGASVEMSAPGRPQAALEETPNNGLSVLAIVLICVGGVLYIALIAVAVVCFLRHRDNANSNDDAVATGGTNDDNGVQMTERAPLTSDAGVESPPLIGSRSQRRSGRSSRRSRRHTYLPPDEPTPQQSKRSSRRSRRAAEPANNTLPSNDDYAAVPSALLQPDAPAPVQSTSSRRRRTSSRRTQSLPLD